MADATRKTELIAELARQRIALTRHTFGLHEAANVPRRLHKSFRQHGLAWLGGAGLLGVLLARFPRRTRKPAVTRWQKAPPEEKVVKAGLLLTLLKIGFDLARPFLLKWATQRVTAYAENRYSGRARR